MTAMPHSLTHGADSAASVSMVLTKSRVKLTVVGFVLVAGMSCVHPRPLYAWTRTVDRPNTTACIPFNMKFGTLLVVEWNATRRAKFIVLETC
jgi:hypothetical protein